MKREYIERVFTDWDILKQEGIFLSGVDGEGKYKSWWESGELLLYCFFKDSKRDGEYKAWNDRGNLVVHKLFKNGDFIKDYLK